MERKYTIFVLNKSDPIHILDQGPCSDTLPNLRTFTCQIKILFFARAL